MAITFPRTDIMTMVDYSAETSPPQLVRRDEMSRQGSGRTIAKSFGSALWLMSYVTKPLPNDDAAAFEAALDSLDGVIQTFEAIDLRRTWPRQYPDGTGANDGVLLSVNANNKALALSGLAAGQIVSSGDFLSFTYGTARALHRAVETVTANGSGVTAQFEVRPHIRPGWTLSPSTAVKLKNPRGIFALVPDSVSSRPNGALHTVVSFQAIQYIE
jgi:hypothetical protein